MNIWMRNQMLKGTLGNAAAGSEGYSAASAFKLGIPKSFGNYSSMCENKNYSTKFVLGMIYSVKFANGYASLSMWTLFGLGSPRPGQFSSTTCA